MLFSTSVLTFQELRSTADQCGNNAVRPFFCPSRLCQAKSEGMEVSHGFGVGNPSMTNICNIRYMQAASYCLPNLAQRRKKNKHKQKPNQTKPTKKPQILSYSFIRTPCTDFFFFFSFFPLQISEK